MCVEPLIVDVTHDHCAQNIWRRLFRKKIQKNSVLGRHIDHRDVALRSQIAWNVGQDFIQTLSGRRDCKTAVSILRREMATFALQSEQRGLRICTAPRVEDISRALRLTLSFITPFVAGMMVAAVVMGGGLWP